jgi:serine/threonine protein kinase/sugar lactone lactonase YvrE
MNATLWQLAKEIFDEAINVPPADRQAFLDGRCGDNKELRDQVERLLASYDSQFLEESAVAAADALTNPGFAEGQMIGRYRIGKLIGTGGMGQVFRAEDTELDRPVAFKVLHHDIGEDKERVRRFIQEAKAASALNHPNILTIHEIGSLDGFRYIVSEYIDGETLRDRMANGLDLEQSLDITSQVAAALKAAHSAGIVHRDIKPENVMIRKDGLVKVLDFGLAKLTEADDKPIDASAPASAVQTSPGLVMGTVAYMSPEQARGQSVDARTDLWSLGVVLHEMLTGRSPFKGESVTELISAIVGRDAIDLDHDQIPKDLQPICRKALQKDKDQRYRSAHDLLNDLQGEKKRMEYAIQPSHFVSVSSTDELKTQLIRPRPTLSAEYIVTTVKRYKYASLIALVAVIAVVAGLSVYQFNGAPNPEPRTDLAAIGSATTEQDLNISRIPSSGTIIELTISPDGKHVAYITEVSSAKNAIRLLELATSRDTELVAAPSGEDYDDLAFSPDGKFLYYVLFGDKTDSDKEDIYRVPITGGAPTRLVERSECGAGLSPDGKMMAFHRRGPEKEDMIAVANIDASHERVIAKSSANAKTNEFNCGGVPKWSPDGKEIACWGDYEEKNEKFKKIFGLNVADGSRRILTEKRWTSIDSAAYLPDGSLIVAAKERTPDVVEESQLWLIAPKSEPTRITSGSNTYTFVSATKNGDSIVALQSSVRRDLWILPNNDLAKARQVTSSGEVLSGFAWMPGGKIVYGSGITGAAEIWTMDQDGANRTRLASNQGLNGQPAATRDGKYLLFNSKRMGGRSHIFRTDADGTNLKQLTNGSGEAIARPSADGKWVYYGQMNPNQPMSIGKVSIDGGEPVVIATASAPNVRILGLDVSKDGLVAYETAQRVSDEWKRIVHIISPEGKPVTTIDLPKTAQGSFIRWTPDGKSIAFNEWADKSGDVWSIPIKGKPVAKRITNFRTPTTLNFDWTPDGRQLLVSRAMATQDAVMIRRKTP